MTGMRATHPPVGPASGMPSRRLVLRLGALTGGALVLGGCGIRLDLPAALVPTPGRTPIPDEAVLVAAARRARDLAGFAQAAGETDIAARHTRQAQVWESILITGGVPTATPSPPGPTTNASPTSTGHAPPTPADLGTAEAALPDVGRVSTRRLFLLSVLAHDGATAVSLGATPAWPASAPLDPAAAVILLGATRAARYAVQVAAAHRAPPDRPRDLDLDRALAARESDLVTAAGASAPAAPLGYDLPFPVHTADDAERLVVAVLRSLVEHGLDPAAADSGATPAPQPAPLPVALAVRLAEVIELATRRGVAPTAFPGLVTP